MQLNSKDLYLLSQCAISAAYQAGHIISEYKLYEGSVKTKKGGSSLASQVVTEVDYLSEAIILQTLLPTCDYYDLALLSEESPDNLDRLEKAYFWCIDPLDGTLPFIQSKAGYAVSIALVSSRGVPYIGIVYDPVEKVLYSAIKGQGAFRNGMKYTLSPLPPNDNQNITLIADQSLNQSPHLDFIIRELDIIAHSMGYAGLTLKIQGGAAMNACWVLEQSPACYFKFPKKAEGGGSLWDFSATACFFHEVGAMVSNSQGNPLDLNRSDSTFMNHQGVLYSSDRELAKRMVKLYDKFKLKKFI